MFKGIYMYEGVYYNVNSEDIIRDAIREKFPNTEYIIYHELHGQEPFERFYISKREDGIEGRVLIGLWNAVGKYTFLPCNNINVFENIKAHRVHSGCIAIA